ncbi:hypothetical protein D3C71_653580 [compost metagenome]
MPPKSEPVIDGTSTMTRLLRDKRRLPAIRFGTYPNAAIAALTLSSVAGETCCGVLIARDTVIMETPAAWATSRTVTLDRSGDRAGVSVDESWDARMLGSG